MAQSRDDFIIAIRSALLKRETKQNQEPAFQLVYDGIVATHQTKNLVMALQLLSLQTLSFFPGSFTPHSLGDQQCCREDRQATGLQA